MKGLLLNRPPCKHRALVFTTKNKTKFSTKYQQDLVT